MHTEKTRVYLSRECVSRLVDSFKAEIPAIASKREAEEYECAVRDLLSADECRDAQGWISIDRHTLDMAIAELDWAYCETQMCQ